MFSRAGMFDDYIELTSETLKVALDRGKPRLAFIETRGGRRMMGDEASAFTQLEVSRIGVETLVTGPDWPELTVISSVTTNAAEAVYCLDVSWDGAPAVRVEIFFELVGQKLRVGFRNVVEQPGYQLLTIRLPALCTVLSAQAGARMVLPVQGGQLVDPARCANGRVLSWPGWTWQFHGAAAYYDGLLATVELASVDDYVWHEVDATRDPLPPELVGGALPLRPSDEVECRPTERVRRAAGGYCRKAGIGAELYHRAPSQRPELRFKVQEASSVSVEFAETSGDQPGWVQAAHRFRAALTCRPTPALEGALLYGIWSHLPGSESEAIDFDATLDIVRAFHHLSDGTKQVAMLIGWQHNGHDTGYPDTTVVNPRLGGRDKLLQLIQSAGSYNASISCHDSFHCAYKHSPKWDSSIVARNSSGELWKTAVWAGGQQYLLNYWSYRELAKARVAQTYGEVPFSGIIYFDEMNVYLGRYDYNPERPASLSQGLEGMRLLTAEMASRGLGVVSESFTGLLAGHLSHGWLFQDGPYATFDGSVQVPFVSFLYHGRATFGGDVRTDNDDPNTCQALYHGRTVSTHVGRGKTLRGLVLAHYLVNVPYLLLRSRLIERFESLDAGVRIHYESPNGASYVDVDLQTQRYRVVVDGRLIAGDDATFAPSPQDGAWLAFSKHERELVVQTPAGWERSSEVAAHELTERGPGASVACVIAGDRLKLQLRAGVPVKLEYRALTPAGDSRDIQHTE